MKAKERRKTRRSVQSTSLTSFDLTSLMGVGPPLIVGHPARFASVVEGPLHFSSQICDDPVQPVVEHDLEDHFSVAKGFFVHLFERPPLE